MIQMNFSPVIDVEIKQRQEAILKEVALIRLADEAAKAREPRQSSTAKVLARIGKELVDLGNSLEQRYGAQIQPGSGLSQQSSPGGCS